MDELQTTVQSNSSDAGSDELSNSLIGKVKCSVSKMLPSSISKWLSPKVDVQNNNRRRRRDEVDSDDDETERNPSLTRANRLPSFLSRTNTDSAPTPVATAPPTKRPRIFEEQQSSIFNSYSLTPTPSVRNSIASSTMIDGLATAREFRMYRIEENGLGDRSNHLNNEPNLGDAVSTTLSQPVFSRAERDIDETSSNLSANPFASNNNDSLAVNFSAHLQKSKSLFSNKSYVSSSSRSLSNYRMRRQPNSSVYRSTSSLNDNNSTSSAASSAIASPFYNGQTTFGGASATSKRFSGALQSQQHRSMVPSRLIPSSLSKSTSSLNSTERNTSCLSTTAKRILDLMNQFNTPLNEVRRVSNALPTASSSVIAAANKRMSLLDVDNESESVDRLKRKLAKPNTPYNRPIGRSSSAHETTLRHELNVPSMSQLLQMKKLTNSTIKVRELASKSDSLLNKTGSISFSTSQDETTAKNMASNLIVYAAEDATNNNHDAASTKRVTKIRNNISKKRMGKNDGLDMPPEPVDLPNIQLTMEKSDEIKFSMPSFQLPKSQPFEANTKTLPKVSTPSFQFAASVASTKTTPAKAISVSFAPTVTITAPPPSFSLKLSSKTFESAVAASTASKSSMTTNAFMPKTNGTIDSKSNYIYRFADPIYVVKSTDSETERTNAPTNCNFKFSQPNLVDDSQKPVHSSTAASPSSSVAASTSFKFSNVDSSTMLTPSSASFSFNSSVKSTETPTASCSGSNLFSFGSASSSQSSEATTTSKSDTSLKELAAKQSQGKWNCSDCFASNDISVTKCLCCSAPNPKASSPISTATSSTPAAKVTTSAVVDDVFKSIVAKQKSSKWSCDACMAENDFNQSKCLCCGGAKPGATSTTSSSTTAAVPAVVDDLFKSIAAKQKSTTWSCSVCDTKNDMNKSKCVCCQQAKEPDSVSVSSTSVSTSGQIKFGSGGIDLGPPTSKFSFGSKSFGEASTSTVPATTTSTTGQFSFGSSTKSASSLYTFGSVKRSETATTSAEAKPQFSFGSGRIHATTSSQTPLGQLAFGGSTTSTSTAQNKPTFSFGSSVTADIPRTDAPKAAAIAPVDDVFKKIASQQASKWSCSECLAQNNADATLCACCNTPKDGSAAASSSSNEKKGLELKATPQFSFGSTAAKSGFSFGANPAAASVESSKPSFSFGAKLDETKPAATFSFGTKPAAESTVSSTAPAFSAPAFSAPATTRNTNTFASPSTETKLDSFGTGAASSTSFSSTTTVSTQPQSSNTFAFGATSASSFSSPFGGGKTSSAAVKPAGGLQFSFGSNAPTFGSASKLGSSDVTDSKTTSDDKKVTVLENVQVKPATNGPTEPKLEYSTFGAPEKDSKLSNTLGTGEPAFTFGAKSAASPALGSSQPFAFGAPAPTPPLPKPAEVAPVKPAFSFGSTASAIPSAANQPFSFGATPTATGSASAQFAMPAQQQSAPVFGSNSFPIAVAEPFKPAFNFGNTTPTFGSQGTNSSEPQPSHTPGVFQFGSASDQSAAPKPAFNFTAAAPAPAFNFSAASPQQPNALFQFGAAPDAALNNIFTPQPQATSSVIQQRRKVRPVRRVNRP